MRSNWLSRTVTLTLLALQLLLLAAGSFARLHEDCCCEAHGKVCHCKSHHKPTTDDGKPCVSSCGTSSDVPFLLLAVVSLPDHVDTERIPAPLTELAWPASTAGPSRALEPERRPPRA